MKKGIAFCFCAVMLLIHGACSEKQDFGQWDDFEVVPTLEASLVYVEAIEAMFNVAQPNVVYTMDINFDAFNAEFFEERVVSGEITYQLENTTSKPLALEIDFLDDNGAVLFSEDFTLSPGPDSEDRTTLFGGESPNNIAIITSTSALRASVTNLGDASSTSSLPDPKLVIRTSGQFMLQFKGSQ